jgi:hypothetical protein
MSTSILDAIPVGTLSKEHLESMVTLKVPESEVIEYKRELKLGTSAEKRELCKDLSALSNSHGGHLIFGIAEDSDGRADQIVGIPFSGDDEDKFNQIVTSGITPRLQRFEPHKVPIGPDRVIFVVKVTPDGQLRQVKHDDNRYYKRVGRITVFMEPSDVASFFEGSRTVTRDADIATQRSNFESAVKGAAFHQFKSSAGALALSIFPSHYVSRINFSDPNVNFSTELPPVYCGGWDRQFRGRSVLTLGTVAGERRPYAVTELSEQGIILAANSLILSNNEYFRIDLPQGVYGYVPSVAIERELIISVHRYLSLLAKLDVPPPWQVGISLLNIRGYAMAVGMRMSSPRYGRIFPGDDLILPFASFSTRSEISSPDAVAKGLRDAFDHIWREFNYPRSYNFDDDGNWSEARQ